LKQCADDHKRINICSSKNTPKCHLGQDSYPYTWGSSVYNSFPRVFNARARELFTLLVSCNVRERLTGLRVQKSLYTTSQLLYLYRDSLVCKCNNYMTLWVSCMAYIKIHWYVSGRIIFQFESAVMSE